jgi:hypothetical protein
MTALPRSAAPSFDTRRRLALHYLVDAGDELLMVRTEVCSGRPGWGAAVEERITVFKADFAASRWADGTVPRAVGTGALARSARRAST